MHRTKRTRYRQLPQRELFVATTLLVCVVGGVDHGAKVAQWVRSVAEAAQPQPSTPGLEKLLAGTATFSGLYDCTPVPGEAYSAAYLTSRASFVRPGAWVNSSRLGDARTNMEGASHSNFRHSLLVKTVDLFDLYVEHLSWYERQFLKDAAPSLRDRTLRRFNGMSHFRHPRLTNPEGEPRTDVIALMPYYCTAGGDAGHSSLVSRRMFLRLTFEALLPIFPNIAVCVATRRDLAYVKKESGLDFFDVLSRFDLSKPSRLGLATVWAAQEAFRTDPRWRDFNYVFYTESDQILHLRNVESLFAVVDSRAVEDEYQSVHLIPHRIMPQPRPGDMGDEKLPYGLSRVARLLARNGKRGLVRVSDVSKVRCCFERAQCSPHRTNWKFINQRAVEFFALAVGETPSFADSAALVAGEGNFLRKQFRVCELSNTTNRVCPPAPHTNAPS